jgi:hypothetical protein
MMPENDTTTAREEAQTSAMVRTLAPITRTRAVDSRPKTAYRNPNSFNRQRFEPEWRGVYPAPSSLVIGQ